MRSTSHSDRSIVNSTNFELPRVRFGYKEDRCLIVIYTGVEKFLKLEMIKGAHGITVLRISRAVWETTVKIVETHSSIEDVGSDSEDSPEDSELESDPEDDLDDVRDSETSKILIFLLFPILGAMVFYWIFLEFYAFS
ncbi:Protein CBG17803 [Caenorhabditis briggsae]|uniref:Protein CBG17803 n=1 Tax=Caenorhabditis briggsae TaxID=6238 RepID=A8XRU2_CAEBR|nr:Protein CBG17803 [Caenorhabditis briggsae]CAP35367.1 Protein CBG17803 [Caenorhabditis briggsae]